MRPKTRLFFFFLSWVFSIFLSQETKEKSLPLFISPKLPLQALSPFFSCLCSSKVKVPSTNTSRHVAMVRTFLRLYFSRPIRFTGESVSVKLRQAPPHHHPLERLPSVGVATQTFTVRSRQFCRAPHPSLQIS